jgi:hypothetical protein
MTNSEKAGLLHVAPPRGVQHATNDHINATKSVSNATTCATSSLKALADAVLQKAQHATAVQQSSANRATNGVKNVAKSCREIARVAPDAESDMTDAKYEAARLGILPRGSAQKIKYVCCLDCGFDRADAIRCKAGVQRTVREHKIRLCIHYARNPQELTPEQDRAIRTWLAHIGETKDHEIAKVLARCQGEPEALAYFLMRAEEL